MKIRAMLLYVDGVIGGVIGSAIIAISFLFLHSERSPPWGSWFADLVRAFLESNKHAFVASFVMSVSSHQRMFQTPQKGELYGRNNSEV